MRPQDLLELMLLSVLWGAAYLFMRAAVPAFGPAPMIALRFGIAVALLMPLLLWRGDVALLYSKPRPMLLVGLFFTALPFMLLGYASQHITAGLVAVLNATAPLFAALIAHFALKEHLGRWRGIGLVIGFAGVALLTAGSVSFKSGDGLLAVAAVLACSLSWGMGANYTRKHLSSIDALAVTVGTLAVAGLFLAPWAWASWPAQPPSARAWAEVVFLGAASSGLGYLMYFRLLRRIGPVRAMSVTFLNPVVAFVGGAAYLGEGVTLQMLGGGAVVLLGTALALGLIGPKAVQNAAGMPTDHR